MMRKNNNRNNNMKHRGGQRRYQGGGGGGGNRGGNDSGNIARQKHHATQQREKYSNMARDAQINGDRVDVEYYLQHVDHYTRVLTDIAAIEAERYAHQREQQAANAPADAQNGEQPASTSSEGEGSTDNSGGGETPPADMGGNQPRMTRHPRRHHSQPSDNGAAEANSNTSDIPLPGSILPPI